MEEDQEVKQHVCKFCSKTFLCGRSLGGHMRSHVIATATETEEKVSTSTAMKPKMKEKELSSFNNTNYALRENPKKTWRLSEETGLVVLDEFCCKECGKGFQSMKALFGHMKCHSEKERVSQNNNNLDDQDSWTNSNSQQSDTEIEAAAAAPNRRRRSKRRRTRYVVATAPSTATSMSFDSEEQEQEEVAMSLMMLSRDVTPWGGFNSVADSSANNNSLHFEEAPSKRLMISYCSEMAEKVTKPRDMKWEFDNFVDANVNSKGKGKSSELLPTQSPENGFGKDKNFMSVSEDKGTFDNGDSNNKYSSIKAKSLDSELRSSSLKTSGAELSKNYNKKGKFECTTCNKVFHSYQALGGHRASHKKIKGCFASRNESSENSTELLEQDLSMKNYNSNQNECAEEENEMVTTTTTIGFDNEVVDTVRESKKKATGHECPICFKVFASGQALGGHKRSHLAGGSESIGNCQSQTIVPEEAEPEVRDSFDLNLPATAEEESNSHDHAQEPFRQHWWVLGGNHKQEALVGLISN